MLDNLTIVHLGDSIHRQIGVGKLRKFPRSSPTNTALYEARFQAIESVETEYFTLVDGYEDILLEPYEETMVYLCDQLDKTGYDLGTGREQVNGRRGAFYHHGVVCRTSAFLNAGFPKLGNYEFNRLVYITLSKRGSVVKDTEIYNWIPSVNGARTWKDIPEAIRKTDIWLKNNVLKK